ncbi:MAG: hypothetical protein IPK82_28225 [Polyangiaceae bacterium]|nr:hypothetical protein [Polyangiaceae bacterium]
MSDEVFVKRNVAHRSAWALIAVLLIVGCVTPPSSTSVEPQSTQKHAVIASQPARSTQGEKAPAAASSGARSEVHRGDYPWLSDSTCTQQEIAGVLSDTFSPPAGFERVAVQPGSFGQWLRGLPLRPKGPVVDHRGQVILPVDDARFARVIALDEGSLDLQQCADSIVRLHAEWLWSKGERDISYRAAAGTPMPFERYLNGERPAGEGKKVVWKPLGKKANRDDHGAFRKYLDSVFMWANTGALARDASKTNLNDLSPGDFFVLAGAPGHAVLVLDVAQNSLGNRVVLLGQGYMPAQSFHVLRPSPNEVWFAIDPSAGGVETPFWPAPFPWSSLRRLSI